MPFEKFGFGPPTAKEVVPVPLPANWFDLAQGLTLIALLATVGVTAWLLF